MRKSRFSEEQIVAILKQSAAGMQREHICREHGISQATFYRWKAKFGCMPINALQRKLGMLNDENSWLRKIVADLTLNNAVLKDRLSKGS
jgi:putative transposase